MSGITLGVTGPPRTLGGYLVIVVCFITWALPGVRLISAQPMLQAALVTIAKLLVIVIVPFAIWRAARRYRVREFVDLRAAISGHWRALVVVSLALLTLQALLGRARTDLATLHPSASELLIAVGPTSAWLFVEVGIVEEPGYYPDFSPRANLSWFPITKQDAALAARKKVDVVTTTYVSQAELTKPDELKQARAIQAGNLRLLHKAGVKLVGPDIYGVTSLAETMNLYDLKVFDNLTLLKMWCEATPEVIFPNRKIGHLKEGYECSFLVLSGDPIQDFANVRKIEMRIKQGEILSM